MKRAFVSMISLAAFSMLVLFTLQLRADNDQATLTFTVDVAQDLTNTLSGASGSQPGGYVQNNGLLPHSTNPDDFARGDTGITDGPIYAAGTIAKGKTTIHPTTPTIGSYHWIGTWAVGLKEFEDAVRDTKGAPPILAFATEQFDLPTGMFGLPPGTLVTEGVWPNAHFTLNRPMVGGTGGFRYFVGETRVENIGENQTGGCNLRVTFILRKAKEDQGR